LNTRIMLTQDETSPLHRIMAIYDSELGGRQKFSNNICAFHIGRGYILSVAHNLRTQELLPLSIPAAVFRSNVLAKLSPADQNTLTAFYPLDHATQKHHLSNVTQQNAQQAIEIMNRSSLDRRFVTLYQTGICSPHLIIQFREDRFYAEKDYASILPAHAHFYEPDVGRHTFKIDLELVDAFYEQDWSIYRIRNMPIAAVEKLPSLEVDFAVYQSLHRGFCCLQAAPIGNLGRLVNVATVDGVLDHFNVFGDPVGGNYFMQGLRYLITGYFRFGSSGAPYLKYHWPTRRYLFNAIQSEACPLQMVISGKREDNFQYVNAIASPVSNIRRQLLQILKRK
jgi:hypothetical protein